MGTGKVAYGSDLIRKKWMREGLIQASAKSFWSAYKGTTKDSIIMQANLETADSGHTVVFDMDGNLSGRPVKGNTTAKGTGEQKKKFSDKVVVEDYRYVVDNGTKFDGKEIDGYLVTALETMIIALRDEKSFLNDFEDISEENALEEQGISFYQHGFSINRFIQVIEFGEVWSSLI